MYGKRIRSSRWVGKAIGFGGNCRTSDVLRLVALTITLVLSCLSVGSWHAPSADARKNRDRTPTTIDGSFKPATSFVKSLVTSPPPSPKPSTTGDVLVFPGSGKRSASPTVLADRTPNATIKSTASAKINPASNAKTNRPSSNRVDPRLRAIGFRSRSKLEQHYRKHGREFGNVTLDEYLAMAQDLRDAPLSKQVVETTQAGGTVSRFDRQTGSFTAFDRDLTLRTFFKPNGGEDYFWRAAKTKR